MTAPGRQGKVAAMAQPSPDLIRGIPIFSDLDDASVQQLATDFIERDFDEGQEIATEGMLLISAAMDFGSATRLTASRLLPRRASK